MIRYKLTGQDMQTYGGTQWVLGEPKAVPEADRSDEMCSSGVLHYYTSPEQAVLFNPIHADIPSPRLFRVEIDREVDCDGLKGCCHSMTLLEELPLPVITTEQRAAFAIRCALEVYTDPAFVRWAEAWLSGEDRSADAARAAAYAANAAAYAANAANAAYAAARADARAAAYAANAANAAYAAARAAANAAYAANRLGQTIDFQNLIALCLEDQDGKQGTTSEKPSKGRSLPQTER